MTPELRHFTPTARALWWYMIATGNEQDLATIVAHSGIPESSVYMVANRYPDYFRLTGSLVRHTTHLGDTEP